jgi:ApaG protein
MFLRNDVVWKTMSTAVTQGIKVSARSRYTQAQSDPAADRFLYSYRITIENTGPGPVQLLRRHWMIHDSLGSRREVEGAGVVGEQPMLQPGDSFTYSSFCDLKSDLGRMTGTYLMRRQDGSTFRVRIPEFILQVPYRCN